jgi:hypothetical protein
MHHPARGRRGWAAGTAWRPTGLQTTLACRRRHRIRRPETWAAPHIRGRRRASLTQIGCCALAYGNRPGRSRVTCENTIKKLATKTRCNSKYKQQTSRYTKLNKNTHIRDTYPVSTAGAIAGRSAIAASTRAVAVRVPHGTTAVENQNIGRLGPR